LTREADCILALGTRLGFNTTFYRYTDIAPTAQIVQVDIDPLAIGRYFPVALGVVADAGTVAGALADRPPRADSGRARPMAGAQRQVSLGARRAAAPRPGGCRTGPCQRCSPRSTVA
jgi:acetolactate synthase-1/2/3 large subunit/sulfoacetaldehyde acetyltransferase